MQKYKRPNINEAYLVNNPFIGTLSIKVAKRTDKARYVNSDGEGYVNKDYMMEDEVPVRMYVSPERRRIICRLSPNAAKLLEWCVQEFEINKDWFWLNKARYMDETGIAYNTYKRSVKELQGKGILLKTAITDVFWVNPHYYFRGNRVNFYSKHEGVLNVRDLSDGEN